MRNDNEALVFEQKPFHDAYPFFTHIALIWSVLVMFTPMRIASLTSLLILVPTTLLAWSIRRGYGRRSMRLTTTPLGLRYTEAGLTMQMDWRDIDRFRVTVLSCKGLYTSHHISFRHDGRRRKIVLNEMHNADQIEALFARYAKPHRSLLEWVPKR